MIYKSSYFKKELRQAYAEDKIGSRRKITFALFSGLASFAIFFVLQTLKKSVLSDAVPEIMQPSYFSTVYIYIHLSFLFNTAYFIIYYDWLFFYEIRNNSWYLLVKMRYQPAAMIFLKFAALLISVILIYTVGFIFVVFLTVFLKYNFILAYMPSLFFSGLIDLVLLSTISMTLSLFIKEAVNARYMVAVSAVLLLALKYMTGFYAILSNRVTMQHFRNLFDFSASSFMPAAVVIFLVCSLICVFKAGNVAKYYTVINDAVTEGLPPGARVVRMDSGTGLILSDTGRTGFEKYRKGLSVAVTAALIIFICLALAFNVLIIFISTTTPGSEVTIRGTIPYVFQSDTMQPDIMQNDLAFFRRVGSQVPVEVGQIVLFEQNNVVYVERVIKKDVAGITVDIDYYPPMSEAGAMVKIIKRQDIYGIYSGRSRWLGALILFTNTIIGRLLFLLVPAVLLFYNSQIMKFARKKK